MGPGTTKKAVVPGFPGATAYRKSVQTKERGEVYLGVVWTAEAWRFRDA